MRKVVSNLLIKFFDTNILLSHLDVVEREEIFYISSITINELEDIKTSGRKTEEVRYSARKAVRWLNENRGKYEVVVYNTEYDSDILNMGLELSPDNKIMMCAHYDACNKIDVVFVTNDILCKLIAESYFNLKVESVEDNTENEYKGFIEKSLSENDMAYFYEHISENIYDLLQNEYLVIKNDKDEVVDTLRWDGNEYQNLKFPTVKSNLFGSVKPYNGDIYQQMALNSLSNNQVTMIKGAAGTGKSYLSLGYLLWALEKHKIDKIVVFCNTVATLNSAKLGYYPGSKDEKLLDSQIGNMLSSKLGGIFAVEQLIQENKLLLLPLSDIRGFDTTGMNAGIYITESQNMDISLMKLALQRIGEDCICIIDGDYTAQVDMAQYNGFSNGMRRMSEVFRGQDFYGEVELQNIYRSKIAEIAEMM